ncbi:MAG: hypothetical protein JO349_02320, partial [Candidatus Eremiobacteraeota bacterium]|nr:hypothetical protein [Candidatus Eremiobacteraeota bacterium]
QGQDPTLDALASRVAALEGAPPPAVPQPKPARAVKPPSTAARAASPPAAAEPNLTLQRLEHHWPAVRDRVREKKPSIAGHLGRARLADFDGATLTLAVPDETTASMLRGHLDIVQDALAATVRKKIAIKTSIAPGDTAGAADDGDAADLLGYAVRKLST